VDRSWAAYRYTTTKVDDTTEGWTAIELHRAKNGSQATSRIARVIFWDAQGQFFIEAFGEEIPLSIAEDLIAEAKTEIRTKSACP
jgi:hypothetical protein